MTPIENSEFVLDTHAWIEYFEGTTRGQPVRTMVLSGHAITPTIVIAELSDFFAKKKREGWPDAFELITSKTHVIELNPFIAQKAGILKQQVRSQFKNNFSLPDAIILTTAQESNARVVTGDRHFKKLPGTVFLG